MCCCSLEINQNEAHTSSLWGITGTWKLGSMIISLSLNITMNRLGGASVIAIFTTRRSHGYVNTTTWLGISQFFCVFGAKFQYFDNGRIDLDAIEI